MNAGYSFYNARAVHVDDHWLYGEHPSYLLHISSLDNAVNRIEPPLFFIVRLVELTDS
jgi:hypothetical protein